MRCPQPSVLALLFTFGLAIAAPVSACHHQGAEERGREATVARHVEDELERRGINDVEVTIEGNALILNGLVHDEGERTRAQAIAREVSGFVEVRDGLRIRRDLN